MTGAPEPKVAKADNYRRRYRRHHDSGIDTGNIIAGVLVLGAAAAVVSAIGNSRRVSDTQRRRYPANRDDRRDIYEGRGLTRAVDMCVAQVERGRERITDVKTARRDPEGWLVQGELASGKDFSCRIDNDGQLGPIDIGTHYDAQRTDQWDLAGVDQRYDVAGIDRQYDDQVYTRIRESRGSDRTGYTSPVEVPNEYDEPGYRLDGDIEAEEPRPAYPGGPLPGEADYGDYVSTGAPPAS